MVCSRLLGTQLAGKIKYYSANQNQLFNTINNKINNVQMNFLGRGII